MAKKAIRGGKMDKKMSEGGKIGGKNCPRGVTKSCFVQGVDFFSEGVTENSCFFNGIALIYSCL